MLTSRRQLLIVQMNSKPTGTARANCKTGPEDRNWNPVRCSALSHYRYTRTLSPSREGREEDSVRLSSHCTLHRNKNIDIF